MTISSKDEAQVKAHPVYSSVLACLPSDRPIPLTEILAQYAHHSRHLATVLLLAQTFEEVLEGVRILPYASFLEAVQLLSKPEEARLLQLLVDYLERVKTEQELYAAKDLPVSWKRSAWNKLAPDTQARLQKMPQRRVQQ
ncbi:hypothetical protein H6F89_34290 [Cyanobacteria bacterium FACHB-63]|nr:hypothetical protein [Cyanobacteria bacterium FACHB-63]